jgi:hypothetical protein
MMPLFFYGRELSVELKKLHERVAWIEDEHATEAVQLSWSVMAISDALVDLGMFPIQTFRHNRRQPRMP